MVVDYFTDEHLMENANKTMKVENCRNTKQPCHRYIVNSTINTLPAVTMTTTATRARHCRLIQENAMVASELPRDHTAFIGPTTAS